MCSRPVISRRVYTATRVSKIVLVTCNGDMVCHDASTVAVPLGKESPLSNKVDDGTSSFCDQELASPAQLCGGFTCSPLPIARRLFPLHQCMQAYIYYTSQYAETIQRFKHINTFPMRCVNSMCFSPLGSRGPGNIFRQCSRQCTSKHNE